MRELFIGIDSGTQSTKALVVDAKNGKVLGEGAKAHGLIGGLPAGAKEAENLSIEIKMAMNPDGTVRQARILDQNRLQSDPFFRAAAESALRAVLNPHCNPLKLPPEKYQQWQNMVLIFDPIQMF